MALSQTLKIILRSMLEECCLANIFSHHSKSSRVKLHFVRFFFYFRWESRFSPPGRHPPCQHLLSKQNFRSSKQNNRYKFFFCLLLNNWAWSRTWNLLPPSSQKEARDKRNKENKMLRVSAYGSYTARTGTCILKFKTCSKKHRSDTKHKMSIANLSGPFQQFC